jgi:primosomal protein N' (replication factor Y) (superfamily II helicase)
LREKETADLAQQGADWLARLLHRKESLDVTVIGPAPCPISRIKSRWRWHLLLKATRSKELTQVGRYFAGRFPVPNRWGLRAIVDRDPTTLL